MDKLIYLNKKPFMKKIIFLSITLVGLTACKKDRICTCTYQDGSTATETTFTQVTKKEAKSLCTSTSPNITCTVR